MNNDVYEIKYSAIKNYFARSDYLFGIALSAVVRGCVTSYSFDIRKRKFVGIVTSLKGTRKYKVEICVTDEFLITFATCECPEAQICYHIGALGLASGYKLPIFSYEVTDSVNIVNDTEPLQRSKEHLRQKIDETKSLQEQHDKEPNTTDDHLPLYMQTLGCLCEICGKVFRNQSYLSIHRIKHKITLICPKTCSLCQRSFKTFYGLKVHQRKHLMVCNICSFRSIHKIEFEKHKSAHKNKDKFECKECGKFFRTHRKRCQHRVSVHMYDCSDCQKKFPTLKALTLHATTTSHAPLIRIYKCNECRMIFPRLFTLKRHYRLAHKMEVDNIKCAYDLKVRSEGHAKQ